MKTWVVKRGAEVMATLMCHAAQQGGLQKHNPFVWVLRDAQDKVIGTLYLATNMNVVEVADGKSS